MNLIIDPLFEGLVAEIKSKNISARDLFSFAITCNGTLAEHRRRMESNCLANHNGLKLFDIYGTGLHHGIKLTSYDICFSKNGKPNRQQLDFKKYVHGKTNKSFSVKYDKYNTRIYMRRRGNDEHYVNVLIDYPYVRYNHALDMRGLIGLIKTVIFTDPLTYNYISDNYKVYVENGIFYTRSCLGKHLASEQQKQSLIDMKTDILDSIRSSFL